MTEQRKQQRVGCDMILNKIESGHTNICRATDVSLGGIRLERVAEAYRSEGESVQLQFALPGEEEPIWVAGQKVYDADGQVGVRFTNISHGHFVKLRAWLRAQAISEGFPEFSL
ncbi:PilZ domain-containing protein [Bradymonadaceae bacterium TMQ3]|uniref:PilZ domain-containing protein n=1 Tax=Lujinxingia sediminis TaxID=2480984 RepID=A0ABY0CTJ2_9DELT|nr:PilZ domain-containing protein [Lujinxingia sediminis]RDV38907.1 PilZ domain-containing protein [Bradymonadaceae bacterium TMQ3]RVU44141.1 PilZ domain-containing protein [Lujinxingia sediminis]TXC76321.1 PilZ domain-containing protein [Bradymonadales bacterium TMQ1]